MQLVLQKSRHFHFLGLYLLVISVLLLLSGLQALLQSIKVLSISSPHITGTTISRFSPGKHHGGIDYVLLFSDDFSRIKWVRSCSRKTLTSEVVAEWTAFLNSTIGHWPETAFQLIQKYLRRRLFVKSELRGPLQRYLKVPCLLQVARRFWK